MVFLAVDFSDQDRIDHARQKLRPERKILHVGKKQPNCRVERDGEKSGDDHGKILGEGKRLEKPSFLGFQGKDRHERDRDDQQREKARSADFLYSADRPRP